MAEKLQFSNSQYRVYSYLGDLKSDCIVFPKCRLLQLYISGFTSSILDTLNYHRFISKLSIGWFILPIAAG